MKHMRRMLGVLLALVLLGATALAYSGNDPRQEISGAVNASALQNNAVIVLKGDTVLTLDANKTVRRLVVSGKSACLTLRGTAALTATAGAELDGLVLESGTLKLTAQTLSEDSGLKARTAQIAGGTLEARDANGGYGVEITDCMTVTGGAVTGTGHYSGVHARQLLVSAGSVTGVGTGLGGEFDSCDGVFTEVLKLSGGSVTGRGSAAGITAERMIRFTEGTSVVSPSGGSVPSERVNIDVWGGANDPYLTYTVLDSQRVIAKSATLGVPAPVFSDVPASQYYAVPVAWANAMDITNGTGPNAFSPNAVCTRGQVVTFLWRAAGSPAPRYEANAFADVAPSDYFYAPVLWAVQNGITNGTDAAHFSPGEPCTRGHVVTFLYRFEHSPDVSGANPFTDVRASDYFCSPVLWAVSRGVTNGVTATQFGPANGCTRGQVVTFLYRDLHRVPTPETLPDDAPVLR